MHFTEQIREHGFAIVEDVLPLSVVEEEIRSIELHATPETLRGGIRNLMDVVPSIQTLAESEIILSLVRPILGEHAFVVRATLFDKTPNANWKVPWHQDVTIAVEERVECEGFGPWSTKEGVLHVQPPSNILESMISVRLHLDPCPADNGALRVLPGTHTLGKLDHDQTDQIVATSTATTCELGLGGALLMRPLLLHASSPSASANHRRVIHLDYANIPLPNGLQWREQVSRAFGDGSFARVRGNILASPTHWTDWQVYNEKNPLGNLLKENEESVG